MNHLNKKKNQMKKMKMLRIVQKAMLRLLSQNRNRKYEKQQQVKWIGNKSDLCEIIYCMYQSDMVRFTDGGDIGVERFARICCNFFNIDIPNFRATTSNIRNRKIKKEQFFLYRLITSILR